MQNVVAFPPTSTMTVEQAIDSTKQTAPELSDVLIVGYYEGGGLFVRSSRMDRKDALWLAECLKRHAMGDD